MFRLLLALRFFEEECDEVAVLALGDAITDGAGIARHLEVLAEGLGQLLTSGLGQFEHTAVDPADLFRAEEIQVRITGCRSAAIAGVSQRDRFISRRTCWLLIEASLLRRIHTRLFSCLLFCICIGL